MKKINRFDVIDEQYRKLKEKLESTADIQEKNLLFRRMINLLNVMEFLLSPPELPN